MIPGFSDKNMRLGQPNPKRSLAALIILFAVCIAAGIARGQGHPQRIGELPKHRGHPFIGFSSAQNGWFYAGEEAWRTDDGGRTWTALELPPQTESDWYVWGLNLCDENRGWLRRSDGQFTTSDGGHTWRKLPNSPLKYPLGQIEDVAVLCSASRLWVAGGRYRLAEPGEDAPNVVSNRTAEGLRILRPALAVTKDEGRTWDLIEPDMGFVYSIKEIIFTGERHGLAVAQISTFFTEDGGSKWTKSQFSGHCEGSVDVPANPEASISAVYFLNNRTGWLAFEDSRFFRTADGGKTWCTVGKYSVEQNGEWGYLEDMFFSTGDHGWGRTQSGYLYETTDGGRIWRLIPAVESFRSLASYDSRKAWLVTHTALYELLPPSQ